MVVLSLGKRDSRGVTQIKAVLTESLHILVQKYVQALNVAKGGVQGGGKGLEGESKRPEGRVGTGRSALLPHVGSGRASGASAARLRPQ